MTFLSQTDAREREQNTVLHDPILDAEASWGETWTASLGMVFDEELSISAGLNNEGYKERESIVKEMVSGGFDLTPYTDDSGKIDYDRLAKETDYGLRTDLELYEERNALLAQRRAYAQDVQERGNGMAQFLGSMTGYMLDPVNVAALPIGAPASALRGLSTLAKVSRVAAYEGAVAGASELLIQPFVFAHKNEIGSPYELEDALAAIGTAALGSAALGGGVAGMVGYLRSAAKIADDYPQHVGAQGSKEALNRMADDLEANPGRLDTVIAHRNEVIEAEFFSPHPRNMQQEAWHGSPHRFDKFSMEHIGSGEGAQAYGHGLYFAEARATAEDYQSALAGFKIDGERFQFYEKYDGLGELATASLGAKRGDVDATLDFLQGMDSHKGSKELVEEAIAELKALDRSRLEINDGSLYRVYLDVDEDKVLDWDKPLSEQSEYVRSALRGFFGDGDTGKKIYQDHSMSIRDAAIARLDDINAKLKELSKIMDEGSGPGYRNFKTDEARQAAIEYDELMEKRGKLSDITNTTAEGMQAKASEDFAEVFGLHGIRYLDGLSRNAGEGSRNFVVFDDSRIRMADEVDNELLVEADKAYARKLEEMRQAQNSNVAKMEHYTDPDAPQPNIEQLAEEDMGRYQALEDDVPIQVGDNVVSSRQFVQEQDDLIDGLEDVKVCAHG